MTDKNSDHQYAENLKVKIWKTEGSRFEASRKLSSQSQLSITSISWLSSYAIAISIFQITIGSSSCKNINNLYTTTTILLSIFILVLSLLEGSKNYQVRAERLYNNAKELSKLRAKIDYLQSCETNNYADELKEIRDLYNELIDKCPENHDSDDFWLFKANHLKKFPDDFSKNLGIIRYFWININYFFKVRWLYLISIIVPMPLFIILYRAFQCY